MGATWTHRSQKIDTVCNMYFVSSKYVLFMYPRAPNTNHFLLYIFMFLHDLSTSWNKIVPMTQSAVQLFSINCLKEKIKSIVALFSPRAYCSSSIFFYFKFYLLLRIRSEILNSWLKRLPLYNFHTFFILVFIYWVLPNLCANH